MKAVKIIITKTGKKRAYYFSRLQMRWLPMPLDEAEFLIATEQAYQVPANAKFA